MTRALRSTDGVASALLATTACSPEAPGAVRAGGPVEAAAPAWGSAAPALPVPVERQSDAAAARVPAAVPSVVVPADLPAWVVLLDEAGDEVPPLVLGDDDLTRLFTAPEDLSGTGPYADHELHDLCGDAQPEAVVSISDGWWGKWLWLCVFERRPEGWSLAFSHREGGGSRGLPGVEGVACGERRWLQVWVQDGWGTGTGHTSLALFEVVEDRLEAVLRTTSSGWLAGWVQAVEVEYHSRALELAAEEGATQAHQTLFLRTSASERIGGGLHSDFEERLTFRQERPGEAFRLVLVDPTGRGREGMDLALDLASEGWLERNVDEVCRLALQGTRKQQRTLRFLADGALEHGGEPARRLDRLLPPASSFADDER